MSIKKEKKSGENQLMQIWRRYKKRPAAMFGLVLFCLIVLMAIFADVLYDYEGQAIAQNIVGRFTKPCAEHPFGTDDYGRDILARVVHGSRLSLGIGLLSIAIAVIFGTSIGAVVGYRGGKLDMVVMRVMDILMAIPNILMAMIIVAVFGANAITLSIALGIANIPTFVRVTRGTVLTVREQEYIESARAIGETDTTIILKHILPNCFAPILVQFTVTLAMSILSVSGLSYLGMGIQPPAPEWGSMLSASRSYLNNASYMAIFPGLAIVATILSLNLVGDGLRDATDPKLR